ncbi:MAG: response regulator [Gallionella sp.]
MTSPDVRTVLVVDDSRLARMLYRGIIRNVHPHWNIIDATNGKEGVEIAKSASPDYITIDYNMPDMNGLEVAKQILSFMPGVPIVLSTANVQATTQLDAKKNGIGFIGKPITEDSVQQALAYFSDNEKSTELTKLSELQADALIEIFNIGVGHAANSLSQIVGEGVSLSIPRLEILDSSQKDELNSMIGSKRICAVSQDFSGFINTRAFLIFPEGKSMDVVRRMLGEHIGIGDLGEMEQEALSEIGNIILNSCVSAMSDSLQSSFQSTLPTFHRGTIDNVLISKEHFVLIMLHINFAIPSDDIDGNLIFLMSTASFNGLAAKIDRFIQTIS